MVDTVVDKILLKSEGIPPKPLVFITCSSYLRFHEPLRFQGEYISPAFWCLNDAAFSGLQPGEHPVLLLLYHKCDDRNKVLYDELPFHLSDC